MNAARALGALLAFSVLPLAGCRHRQPALAPQQAQAPAVQPQAAAPAPQPAAITVVTPLPSIPPDMEPTKVTPAAAEPPPQPTVAVEKPRKRFHRSKPPAAEPTPAPAPAEKESAAVTPPSPPAALQAPSESVDGVTPSPPGTPGQSYSSTVVKQAEPSLGQLSTGSEENQPARSRTLAETQSLELRLTKLKQPANRDAQAVRLQVEIFLKRAREAVSESDLDGAQTLNTKARVLLSELETE